MGRPPSNIPEEEKRNARRARNKVAAKNLREKKKGYVKELESTVEKLKAENSNLQAKVKDLEKKLAKAKKK